MMRLEYEGLHKAEAITTRGARFYKDPAGFAMDRYAYYVCFKCNKVGNKFNCWYFIDFHSIILLLRIFLALFFKNFMIDMTVFFGKYYVK